MPEDAPLNGDAPAETRPLGPYGRVQEMQAKLHRWAVADPGKDRISQAGVTLFRPDSIPVTRYRYRGSKTPWDAATATA